jgi:SAM-dependent methyltransferase
MKNAHGPCYVHGYSDREAERLSDQASTLSDLLHHDTFFPPASRVLEAGCGTGCQTRIVTSHSPGAEIVSMDISAESLATAKATLGELGYPGHPFIRGNLFSLPFREGTFDHIFICFVLEHLPDPETALQNLKILLKPGGSITVIEGDHGSCYFHPETREALAAWHCLIDVQADIGGNSLIGRQLYPLLASAGYKDIHVSPRMVYSDHSKPELEEGFVRKTIIPMVEGVRAQAVRDGMVTSGEFDLGIADLHRTASPTGSFCYTFFKGTAIK